VPALKVLEQFRQTTIHIALIIHIAPIIDECGSVEGLVSPTDILESLVGALPDGSAHEQSILQWADGSWLVDGSLPVEDLKELLHVTELPGEKTCHFQAASGFVIHNLRKIPSEGELFTWQCHRFEVIDMDINRIDKILRCAARVGSHLQRYSLTLFKLVREERYVAPQIVGVLFELIQVSRLVKASRVCRTRLRGGEYMLCGEKYLSRQWNGTIWVCGLAFPS
jgi:hypothetical protein